ncbi:MAG TPA: isovaleryl-CoA dehydrogenase, partial [Cyanobacteria bacterium UBA11371]|nr:isovaleryl-CoA dehydrogenase [Cyanobacteria bacterium UBA11371]
FFAKGEWLVLSLARLLRSFRPWQNLTISPVYVENVAQELVKLYNEDKMFSIVPFQLAKTETQKDKTNAASELQLQA